MTDSSRTSVLFPSETGSATSVQTIPNLRKYILLILFCLAEFIDVFNISALFSAIPNIATELDMNVGESAWIISAVQLTFASFLLVSGRISDIYNPKFAFIAGVVGVAVFPLIIGFLRNKIALFVLRAFTGIFSALTIPSALRLIVQLFPDSIEQSRAIGAFGGSGAVGNVLGVLIGAVLVQLASWPWVFWFATIVAAPISLLGMLLIPRQEQPEPTDAQKPAGSKLRQLDLFGVSLLTSALLLFIFALTSTATYGWASATVLAPLIISIALTVSFFYWETIIPEDHAIVPPKTWFYPNFSVLFGLALLPYFWWISIFLIYTTLWQDVYGWSVIITAVHLLPLGVTAFAATFTGPLSSKYNPKSILLLGLVLMIIGTVLLPFANSKDLYWPLVFPAFAIGSTGAQLVFTHSNIAIFRTTPPEVAGTVGAIYNSALQVGSALGNAVVTSIQASVEAQPSSGGFTGYEGRAAAFWFIFAVVVVEFIAVAVFYRPARANSEKLTSSEPATPDSGKTSMSECSRCSTIVGEINVDLKEGKEKA